MSSTPGAYEIDDEPPDAPLANRTRNVRDQTNVSDDPWTEDSVRRQIFTGDNIMDGFEDAIPEEIEYRCEMEELVSSESCDDDAPLAIPTNDQKGVVGLTCTRRTETGRYKRGRKQCWAPNALRDTLKHYTDKLDTSEGRTTRSGITRTENYLYPSRKIRSSHDVPMSDNMRVALKDFSPFRLNAEKDTPERVFSISFKDDKNEGNIETLLNRLTQLYMEGEPA
jgi:hypothetical protein